jgi:hypothetical protein
MKKNTIYSVIYLCALSLFFACNNELAVINNDDLSSVNKVEVVNGILKFENQEAFDSIVVRLAVMGSVERNSFYESLKFKPISETLGEADKELEVLTELSTFEEFSPQYELFKQKYKNIFLFNNTDIEDLSPYAGFINPFEKLVVNTEGYYFVGDTKIIASKFSSYSDMMLATIPITTRSEISDYSYPANHAFSRLSDRKVGLYIRKGFLVYNKGTEVFVNFTSQKKGIFGWVRYKTEYHGRFIFDKNFTQSNPTMFRGVEWFQIFLHETSGNIECFLGYYDGSGTLTGKMECWSRGVSYADRGKSIIDL